MNRNIIATIVIIITAALCVVAYNLYRQNDKCDNNRAPSCFHDSREYTILMTEWQNIDNLPEEEQRALIAERRRILEENTIKCCNDSMWACFDSLSITEQKRLLDERDRESQCCW